MMPDNLISVLFPEGHNLSSGAENTLSGQARSGGKDVEVLGINDGAPLGPETAIILAGHVLKIIKSNSKAPIVFLINTASQRMTRRDEMLGLNEYLAHLAKSITLAGASGHRTISVLYGTAAAGAFIATALATQTMIAVDGAHPSVMDLPSIARVTKLPLDVLAEKAKETPVFAPGVEPLAATGAVTEIWKLSDGQCAERLSALLADEQVSDIDTRDVLGASRGGRKVAVEIAKRVEDAFLHISVSEKAD
ncbi:MAG: biotin-independent malonate decarboxylase subunit gamma [Acetobacter sp.]|jgi:malonate decarboxylase gamma subunit|nr:biotin-independent malonate decarboxylase subunit gamma [Acetobacter sp.]MCH4060358.1 biotin-independent malonate decarboxylase subunit gamma [Acetobacter sp.]MCH4087298.1 biotin-independent malonate decarboxylase subunit gamma [Acetobacter sp.]MCI1293119.1 biotin-independent malonate decarboxylase subunit gamma [Acetobacter sp.]MCI1319705.1 biotin-independent malonate decarboxylase subunit gamma [Acetobacter sp.]